MFIRQYFCDRFEVSLKNRRKLDFSLAFMGNIVIRRLVFFMEWLVAYVSNLSIIFVKIFGKPLGCAPSGRNEKDRVRLQSSLHACCFFRSQIFFIAVLNSAARSFTHRMIRSSAMGLAPQGIGRVREVFCLRWRAITRPTGLSGIAKNRKRSMAVHIPPPALSIEPSLRFANFLRLLSSAPHGGPRLLLTSH
jgi:hypothetical protein